jgi:tetratricopeptide (TPR) repeat protein
VAIELAHDPLDEAYLQRGITKTYTADYLEAAEDNTRALAINPENTKALNNRGYARFYLGELELAVRDYDRAIKLQPDYARAYANRGDALMALGGEETACRDWRTAAQLGKPPPPELEQRIAEFCPTSG